MITDVQENDARVRCVQLFTGRGHESRLRPVNTGVKNDKGPSTDTGVILDTAEQSKLWDPDQDSH